jgi:uncharacterized membrane protein
MKKKKIFCLLALILLFGTVFAVSSTANVASIQNSSQSLNAHSTINGTVKEPVTCTPSPLPGATVIAIAKGFQNYSLNITDENGEYTLKVTPGTYRVFAFKKGYRQIYPDFWYTISIDAGERSNCSFILRARMLLLSIFLQSRFIDMLQSLLLNLLD